MMASNRDIYILTDICPFFKLLMLSFKIICAQFMNAVEYLQTFLICSYVSEWRQVTLYKIQLG